jgi:integration host factor subunit alpha
VTKNDLVNAVANHGLSKRQSSSVVESVFDIIFRCFEKGEDVKIVGFGHFRIRRKASRRGRNPQTGESIEITARKVLTFKPSKGSNNGSTRRRDHDGSRRKALLPYR